MESGIGLDKARHSLTQSDYLWVRISDSDPFNDLVHTRDANATNGFDVHEARITPASTPRVLDGPVGIAASCGAVGSRRDLAAVLEATSRVGSLLIVVATAFVCLLLILRGPPASLSAHILTGLSTYSVLRVCNEGDSVVKTGWASI